MQGQPAHEGHELFGQILSIVWFQIIWKEFAVLISESKKENFLHGEGQAFAQMAAARDKFVYEHVQGTKRKQTEMDEALPVNSGSMLFLIPP